MTKAPDCEMWFEQGMGCQEQENYAQALDCFEKAIGCNPHFIPAWVYKGIALEQLEDYEAAIGCYEEAIKINPDVADLWYNKGACFCHSYRYEEGLACFNRVLELEPNYALCKTTRALTLAAIPNPIKLPKMRKIEAKNPLLEAEAMVQIGLTREREMTGEVGEMELD